MTGRRLLTPFENKQYIIIIIFQISRPPYGQGWKYMTFGYTANVRRCVMTLTLTLNLLNPRILEANEGPCRERGYQISLSGTQPKKRRKNVPRRAHPHLGHIHIPVITCF